MKSIEDKLKGSILIVIILGFIVGLISVDSVSLFALVILLFYQIRASELVGTDIVHAFILVTVSSFFHVGFGNVAFLLVANLLCGSIPGVIIGSSLSAKVPMKPLQTAIGVIIFISGLKLIY